MKYGLSFFLVFLFLGAGASAQTLMVSDMDDTIKLANVHSYQDLLKFGLDEKSRFMGMSELYNLIVADNPHLQLVYLSKAPTWLMQKRHQSFLKNGHFPSGRYIGRSEYSGETHKLESLRKLLRDLRPRKVIFFGDNGEADPQVYHQIAEEFRAEGVLFTQFIRIVYSNNLRSLKLGGASLAPEQTGFVTPIEIALELEHQGFLSKKSVQTLIATKGPDIINEALSGKNDEYAFPYFVRCGDFQWKWDDRLLDFLGLEAIKKRIEKRCQVTP